MSIKYIWEKEISSIGGWLVTFKDGSAELYWEEYIKAFISDEVISLDKFQTIRHHKIISDVMKIFIETNTEMGEIQWIIQWLIASVENAKDEAINVVFKVPSPANIKFRAVNEIVIDSQEKEETK